MIKAKVAMPPLGESRLHADLTQASAMLLSVESRAPVSLVHFPVLLLQMKSGRVSGCCWEPVYKHYTAAKLHACFTIIGSNG